MIVFHVRIRMNLMSGTVGYATMSNSTKYECYYKLFLSMKSGSYNEHIHYNKHGGTLSADIAHVCA
jgi:hypothetical protein